MAPWVLQTPASYGSEGVHGIRLHRGHQWCEARQSQHLVTKGSWDRAVEEGAAPINLSLLGQNDANGVEEVLLDWAPMCDLQCSTEQADGGAHQTTRHTGGLRNTELRYSPTPTEGGALWKTSSLPPMPDMMRKMHCSAGPKALCVCTANH